MNRKYFHVIFNKEFFERYSKGSGVKVNPVPVFYSFTGGAFLFPALRDIPGPAFNRKLEEFF